MTDGLGVDIGFDAIGSETTALQAVDATPPGGHAVLVGIPAFTARADQPRANGLWRKGDQRDLLRLGTTQHRFPILADPDIEKKIDLDSLISRTYCFDEINEGFRLMLASEVARGVIIFD